MLEIKNCPTSLILYAAHSWELCGRFAKDRSTAQARNPFLKGISVWLILKNVNDSGNIQNYRRSIGELAALCKLSVSQLSHYIAWLRRERLADVRSKALYLQPYRALRRYGINIDERYKTIYYDIQNKTRLEDILTTVDIKLAMESNLNAYWKKLKRSTDVHDHLRDLLIIHGADAQLLDTDPGYFRQSHLRLQIESYKDKEEEPCPELFYFLHKFCDANPDLNCRQDTHASRLGLSHAMSFVHVKRRLLKQGLIRVHKEHVNSVWENRHRKDEKIFHHRYNKRNNETIWFRCDQIAINTGVFLAPKKDS